MNVPLDLFPWRFDIFDAGITKLKSKRRRGKGVSEKMSIQIYIPRVDGNFSLDENPVFIDKSPNLFRISTQKFDFQYMTPLLCT
jgi:hypothetical protein